MKIQVMKSIGQALIGLCFVAVSAQAKDEHHHDSGKKAASAIAKPAKKYKADEALKTRMEAILNTMKSMHDEKEHSKKHLSEVGGKIETTVQDIFKSCKLSPEADAAIHPILAELLAGAKLFKDGKDHDGHEKIHQALLSYEDYFDHPGWAHSKNE